MRSLGLSRYALATGAAAALLAGCGGSQPPIAAPKALTRPQAKGPKFTLLHTFRGHGGGSGPAGRLIEDSQGNLYGTTTAGGSCTENPGGCGIVFKLSVDRKLTILHRFAGGTTDGRNPDGGVIRDAHGNLYGTLRGDGAYGWGAIYQIAPNGREKLLYSFSGYGPDGGAPRGALVRGPSGFLYGTTDSGGGKHGHGSGTVYKLSPAGKLTVMHVFTGGHDGEGPESGLFRDSKGNLYGTTSLGGGPPCYCGTIFRVSPTGKETILHAFTGGGNSGTTGVDGSVPHGEVIRDSAGNIYSTTQIGGAYNVGGVFKLSPSGKETTLLSFTGYYDGDQPWAGVIRDSAGNLYGTTIIFPTIPGCGSYVNGGSVFKLDPAGTETNLHDFCPPNGSGPLAELLLDAAGNLYGTTLDAGKYGDHGVVFKITLR